MTNLRKAILTTTAAGLLATGFALANTQDVFAHGFMIGDRAHLTHASMGNQNRINAPGTPAWSEPLQFEPQSAGELFGLRHVERGLVSLNDAITARDGRTHLANSQAFGGLSDTGTDRWARIPMNGGANDINWHFTAPHRTDEIVYYISRPGFDPSAPLNFADFEKLASFSEGGRQPNVNTTHTINLPTDREGAHVILAAWHLADNYVSWYRVMDITLVNDGTVVDPVLPENPDLDDFEPCECYMGDEDCDMTDEDHNHGPDRLPETPEVNEPGANAGDTWSPYTVYFGGEIVVYNGNEWTAMWWTQGERPGSTGEWGVWRLVGPAANVPTTPEVPTQPAEPEVEAPVTPELPAEPEVDEPEVTMPEVVEPEAPVTPDVPEVNTPADTVFNVGDTFMAGDVVTRGGNQYRALVTFTFWGDDTWLPHVGSSLWVRI